MTPADQAVLEKVQEMVSKGTPLNTARICAVGSAKKWNELTNRLKEAHAS